MIACISETVNNQVNRDKDVNGINNETTRLKPEPTSHATELTSERNQGTNIFKKTI